MSKLEKNNYFKHLSSMLKDKINKTNKMPRLEIFLDVLKS
jgi:hypothetical protein